MSLKGRDVYMKFFPSDWRGDESLRNCSLAARGLWIEMMCIAHKSGGYVLVNGTPPDFNQLARQVGSTPTEVRRLAGELVQHGVCDTRDDDGAIFSRRMVRDAHRREVNQANGQQGGSPILKNRLTESVNRNRKSRITKSVKPHSPEIQKLDPEPDLPPSTERSGVSPKAPTTALLREFDRLHRAKTGQPAVIQGAKDASLLAGIWRSHGEAEVLRLMAAFFASSDPFIARAGYTVGVFVSQAGKLIAASAEPADPNAAVWDSLRARTGGLR